MERSPRWWLVVALLWLAHGVGRAEVISIEPARDNTLYEDAQGSLSNGAGMHLFAGRTADRNGGLIRRGLLQFDVAAAVPAGATVSAVTLQLNMSMTIALTENVSLHRVTADWGEGTSRAPSGEGGGGVASAGDATWVHTFFDAGQWTNPGGDFAAAPSASAAVGLPGTYTWGTTAAMVADVQGWIDEPETNFGWMLIGEESTVTTAKRFDARESPPANRPRLIIELARRCVGDCDAGGSVDVAEIVLGVEIALGRAGLAQCRGLDENRDGRAGIVELSRAVASSFGCAPVCPLPSPAGCRQNGCPPGRVCDFNLGCEPSSCFCDEKSAGWICTDDCGGGTCVDEE